MNPLTTAQNLGAISIAEARKAHAVLLAVFGATIVALVLMSILNLAGLEGANIILFLAGFVALVSISTMPEVILSLLGFAILTPVTVQQVFGFYLKVIKAILMGYMVAAGFLSTWSFAGELGALLWVIIGSLTVGWAQLVWDVKGKTFYWIITIYAIVIVLIGLGKTLVNPANELWQNRPSIFGPSTPTPTRVPVDCTTEILNIAPQQKVQINWNLDCPRFAFTRAQIGGDLRVAYGFEGNEVVWRQQAPYPAGPESSFVTIRNSSNEGATVFVVRQ